MLCYEESHITHENKGKGLPMTCIHKHTGEAEV